LPALDLATVIRELIILFVVIDPIGTLPVFFFATRDVPEHLHWRFALRAVLVAGAVLFFFLIAGQLLLEGIGLRLGSFQIAGGVVLFLFAMTMVFGEAKPAREIEEAERDHMAGAVFPLAIPSIASPGAMLAVVILTDNHRNTLSDQAMTGVLLFLILLATLAILLLARPIKRLIGNTGANIVSRVMGIILATVAVDSVMSGFEALGVLELQGAGI